MIKTLNGDWLFKSTDQNEWKKATVPGCNFLDLMRNGDIPDPFISTYEKDVRFVGEKDWEYKRCFEIDESELECDDILLNCKMLDTICEVYINSRLLFVGDNCFVGYSKSVKSLLKEGENEIRIVFKSPVNYVSDKYKKCLTPMNSNGQNGIVHIRKPQSHFGWDWGPVLPSSGITKDIELQFVNAVKIDSFTVTQRLENGKAYVNVNADLTEYGDYKYKCELSLTPPSGDTLISNEKSAEFVIDNPELWWTYELSGKKKQPLYTVSVFLQYKGKIVDVKSKKIGLRTVELNRQRDKYGRNFQFVLNGVPLFIKGSNYIPPDSFITRFDKKKLDYMLDAVQFSNMNMIRVWGGGYYESDEFYNACDERGILVWQDFQFACQAYPFFDDEFLENVKREVAYNVKRLCHHPSLAVWNGNNEIEDMHAAWVSMTKYVDWTEKFFYHILEDEIRKYDKSTPYTPTSPVGEKHNYGVGSDNVGDTHLWAVWHGLKPMNYYRKRLTRFCSEFGFESLPDMKTIDIFAEHKGNYSLDDKVFNAHQKCANGNDKMVYYVASRFNLPKKFKNMVYLSQVTQNECIADATEHWRRNKGRCNGSMYWQLNDCWGVCSWSSIDYYGNYKALQYGARHFNAPLSVSVEDTKDYVKIYALNDLNTSQYIAVSYEIFDFLSGTKEADEKHITIDRIKNECVFDLDVNELSKVYDLKRTGIAVRVIQNGEVLQQKTVLFDKEKNLSLPKASLKTRIEIGESELKITVKSDAFARLVRLESNKSVLPFSDNFFDLLPNESRSVTMQKDENMTLRELAESISVYSLSDVRFNNDKIYTLLKQAKVFLSPVNISNAIYHGKLAKDVELSDK